MQNTGSYMSCNQYKVAHITNHLHPEFLFNSMATFIWSLFTDILFRVASLNWDWCQEWQSVFHSVGNCNCRGKKAWLKTLHKVPFTACRWQALWVPLGVELPSSPLAHFLYWLLVLPSLIKALEIPARRNELSALEVLRQTGRANSATRCKMALWIHHNAPGEGNDSVFNSSVCEEAAERFCLQF